MAMTNYLPSMRVKPELMKTIDAQAERLKLRRTDIVRLALAFGVDVILQQQTQPAEAEKCKTQSQ